LAPPAPQPLGLRRHLSQVARFSKCRD
jgi:hypothetical protein